MYLRDFLVENTGPLKFIDLALPFHHDGLPKPLVIVGENGSGKSILLSYVADALVEFAKTAYRDIVPGQTVGFSPYFRLNSDTNRSNYAEFSIALLRFAQEDLAFHYVEKTGKLAVADYGNTMRDRFSTVAGWPTEGQHKAATGDQKAIETFLANGAVCYFPASRNERPHWLNVDVLEDEISFDANKKFHGVLKKPIFVERNGVATQRWLLDVFLDSMMDVHLLGNQLTALGHVQDRLFLRQGRTNVESLLKQILRDESVSLRCNYRNSGSTRLCVTKEDRIVIPSLDHLSTGQATLFNLFASVVRYADKADIKTSTDLGGIKGIVLVDEIDSHLHGELQHEVLPKLLRLFPKVQFVLTTHSPLFLLGMEREFGSEGFQIIELPIGNPITTERFAEFRRSLEYYQSTRAYETELQAQLLATQRPLVLTEGETDALYIKAALELLEFAHLLDNIDIQQVGGVKSGQTANSGKTGLDQARKVIEAAPALVNRKVLLLYDCDTNKLAEDAGSLSVRAIPQNLANLKIKRGIENLLPEPLFEQRFYPERKIEDDCGGSRVLRELNKMDLCKWVCEERRDPDDFVKFSVVIEILTEFLGSIASEATTYEPSDSVTNSIANLDGQPAAVET